MKPLISILILTYNAPEYVRETLESLAKTRQCNFFEYEVIVLDNASNKETRSLLLSLKKKGLIDKLFMSEVNTLFAKGNNIASTLCDKSSKYILLLNSDVQIRKSNWLKNLYEEKQKGNYAVAAYGFCLDPLRADGYAFLVDKELYLKHKLDESFPWYWGLTKFQSLLIKEGHKILAIKNHNKYLYHYGGKSGQVLGEVSGKQMDINQILSWFKNKENLVTLIDYLPLLSFYQRKQFKVRTIIKKILFSRK